MTNPHAAQIAIVTGDVTIDWNLAHTQRGSRDLGVGVDDSTQVYWQWGGAALLARVIERVAASLERGGTTEWSVRQPEASQEPPRPGDDRFVHAYAMWAPFKASNESPEEPEVWRVQEALGYNRLAVRAGSAQAEPGMQVADDTPDAHLVVLDDAGPGFRDSRHLWPQAIVTPGTDPWLLIKMSDPVAEGELWEELYQNRAERLIVVTNVNSLRRTEVQISRELSWERTAQDLFWELVHNPRVNALSRCAHVVVSVGAAGAVLLSRKPAERDLPKTEAIHRCFLFFDPEEIEGMWQQRHPGGMIGYNTCLTAALARAIMGSPDQPAIHAGIQSGLAAMRLLHLEGYGRRGAPADECQLFFPVERIVDELTSAGSQFTEVQVQDPVRALIHPFSAERPVAEVGFWTILEDNDRDNLAEVADQIVRYGAGVALHGVPLGRFGHLLTVDRHEIESFRSIRALVSEYCHKGQQRRPLSIAVFGAPGSGKSFGITEVTKSLLPGQIKVREFNLSQFGSPADLHGALHQVRDVGLGGRIPLVFWDEFDTSLDGAPLGWLRYFLAPMQDGHFQEGQIIHPIGRAIFVFVGGTSDRMAGFGQRLTPAEFQSAKGPDFVSRLKGYVNVRGPNPKKNPSGADGDPYYIIRRAILVRSILELNAPQLFSQEDGKRVLHIDRGVLRAFLQTGEYRHGIRSMEAIVAMSLLTGKTSYERSCLPAAAQLDLHVDGQEFLALVQQIDLSGQILERLARAAHQVYCKGLEARGYRWGTETDEQQKTHSALVPYDDLDQEFKEQNRAYVRDIPNKLARIGYVMIPARSDESPFDFPGDDLEQLAIREHERYVKAKLAVGWRPGPETSDEEKVSPALAPWDELDGMQKEKDRDLIRGIPDILARAGYAIVRLR
jgi:hypothetical protein